MKKAIVLLLALAVLGGAVFAEGAAYTLSGSASLTWGYDLDTDTSGFENVASFEIVFPIAVGASKTTTGEGTYGTITVKDIYLSVEDLLGAGGTSLDDDDDDADDDGTPLLATLTAKIVSGPFYMSIYNRSSLNFNKATDLLDGDLDLSALIDANAYGTKIGYDSELYDFGFIINSKGDFTNDDADATYNVDNEYAIGVVTSIIAVKDLLTINAGFSYDVTDATKGMGAYITLPVTVGALSITAAADFNLTEAAPAVYDAKLTIGYDILEGLNVTAKAYYSDLDDDIEASIAVESEDVGMPGLYAYADFGYYNALETAVAASWAFNWELYLKNMLDDVRYVKPFASGSFDSADLVTLTAGVEAKLIDNTVFTLKYVSDDLTATDAAEANEKGNITVTAKITL